MLEKRPSLLFWGSKEIARKRKAGTVEIREDSQTFKHRAWSPQPCRPPRQPLLRKTLSPWMRQGSAPHRQVHRLACVLDPCAVGGAARGALAGAAGAASAVAVASVLALGLSAAGAGAGAASVLSFFSLSALAFSFFAFNSSCLSFSLCESFSSICRSRSDASTGLALRMGWAWSWWRKRQQQVWLAQRNEAARRASCAQRGQQRMEQGWTSRSRLLGRTPILGSVRAGSGLTTTASLSSTEAETLLGGVARALGRSLVRGELGAKAHSLLRGELSSTSLASLR